MADINVFEVAARKKYRFPTTKGEINVEGLYQLSVIELDQTFKTLNKTLSAASEESLLNVKSPADKEITNKIAIVKHIVAFKQAQADKKRIAAARAEEVRVISEALADVTHTSLRQQTPDQLQQRLAALTAAPAEDDE